MNRQQKEFYKTFSEHGSGDAKISIAPKEVLLLLYISSSDLNQKEPSLYTTEYSLLKAKGFYNISHQDIERLPDISEGECFDCMKECGVTDINTNVIYLYLKNLCDLYRRRVKYNYILQTQPFPNAEQIVPRSLLEYGNCENMLLADWLEWRKWIFDIDNRSAQETGYVFEPILASCLGGEAQSAKNSIVKRIDDNGNTTSNGRQVDCYVAETKEVYELKMRVTIAASGQGRFSEEMSFPKEAERAGLTPILVVFDGNESDLLRKLKLQYINCGGRYYIGQDAWNMLVNKAGKEMGIFINKYIYPPINAMEDFLNSHPHDITVSQSEDNIIIYGEMGKYVIKRK